MHSGFLQLLEGAARFDALMLAGIPDENHAVLRSNATDGLEAAAREKPALIVLDLIMPGVDGLAFLARFRTEAEGNRTPVIVWTSKDLTREELKRLRASAQAVVRKGEGAAALRGQLKTMLHGAEIRSDAR